MTWFKPTLKGHRYTSGTDTPTASGLERIPTLSIEHRFTAERMNWRPTVVSLKCSGAPKASAGWLFNNEFWQPHNYHLNRLISLDCIQTGIMKINRRLMAAQSGTGGFYLPCRSWMTFKSSLIADAESHCVGHIWHFPRFPIEVHTFHWWL